ncbi:sigma-70 family RNA polymerase sigma factor [Aliiglaciecola sp. CAU 1673]|uniref:sigma-70 family RNA polymerase sigma factor n=1 Tax=Aliiglaciecola sp. CAU 1673 TaxID=3032595 RepID=UPI0023DBDBAA|nr:sigma-70 family RNA polymerase sigma factor [Aliiglaciecola sp. CAU 1673]MDF2179777.1 sigma-70 family RNA polymerase sigma factor [Aliiglaciecola sp. CAU 1673]
MEHEELFPLLCDIADGSRDAFAKLYTITSGQIYAVALKMLKHKELAEEATQDTFIKIWHGAASYQRSKGTVLTWMVSIVRYRALDLMRYHNIRNEVSLSPESDGPSASMPLPSSERRRLAECIDELEEQQRQAIHLAFYGGLSHQEVVEHLDSPLGTIKSWIRRGLQSLQRCLSI